MCLNWERISTATSQSPSPARASAAGAPRTTPKTSARSTALAMPTSSGSEGGEKDRRLGAVVVNRKEVHPHGAHRRVPHNRERPSASLPVFPAAADRLLTRLPLQRKQRLTSC